MGQDKLSSRGILEYDSEYDSEEIHDSRSEHGKNRRTQRFDGDDDSAAGLASINAFSIVSPESSRPENHSNRSSSPDLTIPLDLNTVRNGQSAVIAADSDDDEENTANAKITEFLDRIKARQAPILEERMLSMTRHVRSSRMTNRNKQRHRERNMSLEDIWSEYVARLPEDFFTSEEAQMAKTDRIENRAAAYKSLYISHENCSDMRSMFVERWEPMRRNGQMIPTYDNFRVAVGQYARFAVAAGVVDVHEICKNGNLFRLVCHKELVRVFLEYFIVRASCGTVMCKALHIRRYADFAENYYLGKSDQLRALAIASANFSRATFSAQKTESRRQSSLRQSSEHRYETMSVLTRADFEKAKEKSSFALDGIIETIEEIDVDPLTAIRRLSKHSPLLINKWCLNFLCFLVFNGSGQRPQAFCQIQVPCASAFNDIQRTANRLGFFPLDTMFEKRARASDAPHLYFHKDVLPYLKFHVRYIRQTIIDMNDLVESFSFRPVVVNSRDGTSLDSKQVTRSVKLFLTSLDPELKNIGTMSIRSSFATIMIQRFAAKEIMRNSTEEDFLSLLAKIMNTSMVMIRQTYNTIDKDDFNRTAFKFGELFSSIEDN